MSTRDILRRLRLVVSQEPSFPEHNSPTANDYFPTELQNAKFVFIRNDATQPPLSAVFHGPYHVLEHGPKTFRLKVGEKEDEFSDDRLKAACYEEEHQPFHRTAVDHER